MSPAIIVAVLITVALMVSGGLTTKVDGWYRDLRKPSWNPPNWAFGPAWALLLIMAAAAGVVAWDHARGAAEHGRVVALYAVNILFYSLWSPLFFRLQRPAWALIDIPFLWLSTLASVVGLWPLSPLASALLTPLLAWITFAGLLNLEIVRLNRSRV
jgi:tryptophan-rich sensory protein